MRNAKIHFAPKSNSNRTKPGIKPGENELILLKKELEELRLENKILAEKNKTQEIEISSFKAEVESLMELNKEYEKIIEENKRTKNLLDNTKKDEETKKLRNDVETWKREYFDLLDKSMSTNVNSSRLLFNDERVTRPQTAKLSYPVSSSRIEIAADLNLGLNMNNMNNNLILEKTLGSFSNSNIKNESTQMSVTKRKNSLDDSINSDEEKNKDNNNKSRSYSNSQNEDDDEIDELLKKSVTNLNNLKKEIKVLSKASIISETEPEKGFLHNIQNKENKENKSRSISKPKISPKNSSKNIIVKNKVFNINKK